MASTQASRRDVFRAIATGSYREWPAYHTIGLYDRSSLGALEEDVQTVASVWFAHEAHNSVDEFICELPLRYVDLAPMISTTSQQRTKYERWYGRFC